MEIVILTIDIGIIDDLSAIFTVRKIIMIVFDPILILAVAILEVALRDYAGLVIIGDLWLALCEFEQMLILVGH
jgi:hypothetical protein